MMGLRVKMVPGLACAEQETSRRKVLWILNKSGASWRGAPGGGGRCSHHRVHHCMWCRSDTKYSCMCNGKGTTKPLGSLRCFTFADASQCRVGLVELSSSSWLDESLVIMSDTRSLCCSLAGRIGKNLLLWAK